MHFDYYACGKLNNPPPPPQGKGSGGKNLSQSVIEVHSNMMEYVAYTVSDLYMTACTYMCPVLQYGEETILDISASWTTDKQRSVCIIVDTYGFSPHAYLIDITHF